LLLAGFDSLLDSVFLDFDESDELSLELVSEELELELLLPFEPLLEFL
jgi:hypothetical protein